MGKHIVVCQYCGKQFDANKGGYYNSTSRRYTCKSCGSKAKKEQKEYEADKREAKTGMRQSMGAMIAKIAVGVVFFFIGFTMDSFGSAIIGIVIGLALIAWGLLPWLMPRLKAKKDAEAEAAKLAAEAERIANAPKICPACGAHTKGQKCEYCGAPLPE